MSRYGQLGGIRGLRAQFQIHGAAHPLRALLPGGQVEQAQGFPGQTQGHFQVAAGEGGGTLQPFQRLAALGHPALGQGETSGGHADRPHGCREGAGQMGLHLGLGLRAGEPEAAGIHRSIQAEGPGLAFEVHVHAALQRQWAGGRGGPGAQLRQAVGDAHVGRAQAVAEYVHEEIRRCGGNADAEHLGLLGHGLAFQQDAVERPVQPDPAAAGAVEGQVQVGRLEPLLNRQAGGAVGHVQLILAAGHVAPGEPEVPVGVAGPLFQIDVRNPQHVPVDAHVGLEQVGPGPVPAGVADGDLALELEPAVRRPVDPGLHLGGARHVHGRLLAGGVGHADVPGQEHPGHILGVRGHAGLGFDRRHPVPAQGAASLAMDDQLRKFQVHRRSLEPAVLQVEGQAADLLAGLQELARTMEAQAAQLGQGPGRPGQSGRQACFPLETQAELLEETGAGVARHRRQRDGVGLELELVAGPGGPVAAGLQPAFRRGPGQPLQADLGGAAPGCDLEAAGAQGQGLGLQPAPLDRAVPGGLVQRAVDLGLEIQQARGGGLGRAGQPLDLDQVQVAAGLQLQEAIEVAIAALERQAVGPQAQLAVHRLQLLVGDVGGQRQVAQDRILALAEDDPRHPGFHPQLVGRPALAGELEAEITAWQPPGGFPHVGLAVGDLQAVQLEPGGCG